MNLYTEMLYWYTPFPVQPYCVDRYVYILSATGTVYNCSDGRMQSVPRPVQCPHSSCSSAHLFIIPDPGLLGRFEGADPVNSTTSCTGRFDY
eukprot:COSAG02_NODE_238_length_27685_cov_11.570792_11_plen_92_part_00